MPSNPEVFQNTGFRETEQISSDVHLDLRNESKRISTQEASDHKEAQKAEQKISPTNEDKPNSEPNFDWKQLQRYILNSKVFEFGGSFNSIVIARLENLQLPNDDKNLILFAKDCEYLMKIRQNLNIAVRSALLKKYGESVLRLEQIAPGCSDLPHLKINFESNSKLNVKNILSFLK